jgi:tripartite-type tricarboxylate transporter receptor subunit TctC
MSGNADIVARGARVKRLGRDFRWPGDRRVAVVPTMVELGYKDFISDTFQGFLPPAKTAPAIVELLSAKSLEILKRPVIAEQLRNDGFEILANGPAGIKRRIDDEVPKWRDNVAKAGTKPV